MVVQKCRYRRKGLSGKILDMLHQHITAVAVAESRFSGERCLACLRLKSSVLCTVASVDPAHQAISCQLVTLPTLSAATAAISLSLAPCDYTTLPFAESRATYLTTFSATRLGQPRGLLRRMGLRLVSNSGPMAGRLPSWVGIVWRQRFNAACAVSTESDAENRVRLQWRSQVL